MFSWYKTFTNYPKNNSLGHHLGSTYHLSVPLGILDLRYDSIDLVFVVPFLPSSIYSGYFMSERKPCYSIE
jgi:hypothetical protein